MKVFLPVFLGVSVLISAANGAEKESLKSHAFALKEVLVRQFLPDFTQLRGDVKQIMETDEYDDCVDPWFWSSRETQLKDCLKVKDLLGEVSARASFRDRVKNEKFQSDVKVYDDYAASLDEGEEKDLALSIRSEMIGAYSGLNQILKDQQDEFDRRYETACWHKDIGKSYECALERLLKSLENDLPELFSYVREELIRKLDRTLERI